MTGLLWVQESYRLLFLSAPAVSEMEESIRTLRETIAAAKETIAEREALISKHNPRLFQTLQVLPVTTTPHAVKMFHTMT